MLANMELDPEEAKEMADMQQRIKGLQNTDWSEKYVYPYTTHEVSLSDIVCITATRLAGALAGKSGGSGEVAETADARAIKASGTSSSANMNARKRKGR
ncbi:hypothetical protein QFC19_008748 [Naganishia cerealis]|uniref:Uncharacterized protein n=1 Tax=Naganishia cerealis TaxID=610337 RepID=A0ACC2UZD9_9TREE|nr:hypothetical protein QFC19_008748 [Naganishia cerealis]